MGLVTAQWLACEVSSRVLKRVLISWCSTSGSEAMWVRMRETVGFS